MARRNRRRRSGRRSSRRRSGGRSYRKSSWMKWVLWLLLGSAVVIVAVAMFAKNPPKWVPKFLLKMRKDGKMAPDQGGSKPSDQVLQPVADVTTKI